MSDVTRILNAIERGQTQATALVHEAYLRLAGEAEHGWDSRGHFFAAAAEAMRRILVDNARRKRTVRHGGDRRRVDLTASTPAGGDGELDDDLLALDDAIEALARKDPLKASVVKLRYFAGLSIEQTARSLGISAATAKRYWVYARAWLIREMQRSG
jgi:RNA polymerase sigma factor (TIGR02999 family)